MSFLEWLLSFGGWDNHGNSDFITYGGYDTTDG